MAGAKNTSSKRELKLTNSTPRRPISAGRKPVAQPTTILHEFLMAAMIRCQRIVLFEPEIKILVYLAALICGSLVCDFKLIPGTYFSRKNNMLNYYFVKLGWGWTLFSVAAFLGVSSWVYCCGNIGRIKKHFYRLLIGTAIWFSCTYSFIYIKSLTEVCLPNKFTPKASCHSFDISGHAFMLIYCSLLITEEAKSIRVWEKIGELIRNKEFIEEGPLKGLSTVEMKHLKEKYEKFTPYVRAAFVNLTLFSILWDGMLVATIVYFHSMVEKVVGGSIAILMWYVTYKWWYLTPSSPGLPHQGCFKVAV